MTVRSIRPAPAGACGLFAGVAIFLLVCAAGCGGGIKYIRAEKKLAGPPAKLTKAITASSTSSSLPLSGPLVEIHYPTGFVPNAAPAQIRRWFVESQGIAGVSDDIVDAAINESFAKTLYYVTEFYQVLSTRLPDGSVILRPGQVVPEYTNTLGMRSYDVRSPTDFPPYVVKVDFPFVRCSINRQLRGGIWSADTVGDRLWVSGLIHVQDMYRPAFPSDMAASPALRTRVRAGGGKVVVNTVSGTPLTLIHVNAPPDAKVNHNVYLAERQRVEAQATRTPTGQAEMPFGDVWSLFANATVETLDSFDWRRAGGPFTGIYITYYDTRLGNAYDAELSGRDTMLGRVSDADKRLKVLQQFLDVERKFVAAQDRELVNDVYHGEFGQSMRQQLLGEMAYIEAVNQAQARQGMMQLTGLTSAFAMGLYAGSQAGNLSPQAQQALWSGIQQNAVNLAAGMEREARLLGDLKASLDRHLYGAAEASREFVVTIEEQEQVIRGRTLAELRRKCSALYRKRFPDAIGTEMPDPYWARLRDAGRSEELVADVGQTLARDPQSVAALLELASIRATHPDAKYRNGAEALRLAERAKQLQPRRPGVLGAVAAAHAELGQFDKAVQTAEAALAAIRHVGLAEAYPHFEARVTSYRGGKPWREATYVPKAAKT